MKRKRLLLAGQYKKVVADLAAHQCHGECLKNDNGKCLVRVAQGYLENNERYMKNYKEFINLDLPVGSGEAESGIRHIIKRRMAVAGAWEEENASRMLALLSIRKSGWWDDFWRWRDQRDRQAWKDRQQGKVRMLFRAKRRANKARQAAA
jgi:hypothetical protein